MKKNETLIYESNDLVFCLHLSDTAEYMRILKHICSYCFQRSRNSYRDLDYIGYIVIVRALYITDVLKLS